MIQTIYAKALGRYVKYEVILPAEHALFPQKRYPLLILNDGQDAAALKLEKVIHDLIADQQIVPIVAVAIHCGERKQEYGVAGIADYAGRGSKADIYTKFLVTELLPLLESNYPITNTASERCIAGFSLGGLSAFDIAWHHEHLFSKVGVFSGSFWWRARSLENGYTPADRIMHKVVKETKVVPNLKVWLQTSSNDERADRDHDGIIDAIGDTVDLIKLLKQKGFQLGSDIYFLDYPAGGHDLDTMHTLLPRFLAWAFAALQ
jgi:enterochelin esterase-like enzyme